ncbi:MAG: hypothetical protein ACK5MQ_13400 [Pikeienuella sp.]
MLRLALIFLLLGGPALAQHEQAVEWYLDLLEAAPDSAHELNGELTPEESFAAAEELIRRAPPNSTELLLDLANLRRIPPSIEGLRQLGMVEVIAFELEDISALKQLCGLDQPGRSVSEGQELVAGAGELAQHGAGPLTASRLCEDGAGAAVELAALAGDGGGDEAAKAAGQREGVLKPEFQGQCGALAADLQNPGGVACEMGETIVSRGVV